MNVFILQKKHQHFSTHHLLMWIDSIYPNSCIVIYIEIKEQKQKKQWEIYLGEYLIENGL